MLIHRFFSPPVTASTQSLTNTVHKTNAATNKLSDMWCYSCDSMDNGTACVDNITANYSSFMKKVYISSSS